MTVRLEETNRKIHLDFHTPYWVQQVGQDYDPEALIRGWKDAKVNAVTVVFGACACGNAYYDTQAAPVHPGLQQDLLTPLLPIAKREGIHIYVHFSVGIHDRAVIEHPEWAMQREDGSCLDTVNGTQWGWPCFNSPFVEQWFWPQLEEFVPRFPDIAGIFLDMVMYPAGTCYCNHCRQKATAQGFDINQRAGKEKFELKTLDDFMSKTKAIIKRLNPDMKFTSNNQWYIGGARHESLDYIELEAPVSWSSYHFPVISRYIRTLPMQSGGMTTRFPKNWGYFGSINNEIQLKFECATILATLGSCCIGDQLTPSGAPDEGVYDLVGQAYRFVEEREAWALHAKSVPYLAIVADHQQSVEKMMHGEAGQDSVRQTSAALYGSGLVLLEGNRHFDVLDQQSDFADYRLLWLPENKSLDPALAPKIKQFVLKGGKLLVSGNGLWQHDPWREVLEEMASVRYVGVGQATGAFIRPLAAISQDIPQVPYYIKANFVHWEAGSQAEIVADTYRPYEDINPATRFGHFHAPSGEAAEHPGAVISSYGKGKVAVMAAPLAAEYFNIGSRHLRQMVLNVMDRLLADQDRIVDVDAQSPAVEISLMRQENRWILHLIQYGAKRHTGNTVIEEIPPRYNIPVRTRPHEKPVRVRLAPSGEELHWEWENGQVTTVVPELHIHQMVVLEFDT